MQGWAIPPPENPLKTRAQLKRERTAKVRWLAVQGLLKSDRLRRALLKIAREDFVPRAYRDHVYEEIPLPLPGASATISCPHSYPLFYEPLGLDRGHRFLEIGTGSGYGAAVAREVVGTTGLVVTVEIDPLTLEFARRNLERAGYRDIVLVPGDGGLGHAELAPYDCIAVTAASPDIPPPLLAQLKVGGRLVAPILQRGRQDLVLATRTETDVIRETLCEVLYVNLRGRYGA